VGLAAAFVAQRVDFDAGYFHERCTPGLFPRQILLAADTRFARSQSTGWCGARPRIADKARKQER
jgi:hypothetical protein